MRLFLIGDVRDGRGWRSAAPLLLSRWEPVHIARANLFGQPALTLRYPAAGCHAQDLAERVSVPCCASAGLDRGVGTDYACQSVRMEPGINAHHAPEMLGRSLAGWL